MSVQILRAHEVVAVSRKARRVIQRCIFAAAVVGAGVPAISGSAFGADLPASYSAAMAVPSQPAPAGRRPIQPHPINHPEVESDRSAQRARMIDQLYEELMRRTAPGCQSGSTYASMGGGC